MFDCCEPFVWASWHFRFEEEGEGRGEEGEMGGVEDESMDVFDAGDPKLAISRGEFKFNGVVPLAFLGIISNFKGN